MSSRVFILLSATALAMLTVRDITSAAPIPIFQILDFIEMFTKMDRSNDGVLDADDFNLLADALSTAANLDADQDKKLREVTLPMLLNMFFQSLGATGQQLTQQQFIDLFSKLLTSGTGKETSLNGFVVLHEFVDGNGDGYLDKNEYSALPNAFNVDPVQANKCFDAIDANGDGKLSGDEFGTKALTCFFSKG